MIRSYGFPESRQEWSNDSERIVKIQPQSAFLSDPDRIYRQQKAIPVAWNAYNGDQVFRRRRECNRTVGIKTGRIAGRFKQSTLQWYGDQPRSSLILQ